MGYMSPQMLNRENTDPFKNDVWSFGVLVYKSINLKFPFKGKTY